MTTPWSTLEPWDKAAQWIEAAPELASDVVQVAKNVADHRQAMETDEAEHRRALERQAATHREKMDARLWYTQLISLAINALSLGLLVVVAVRFGSEAVIPALTVVGASGGVTAAAAVVNNSVRKTWQKAQEPAKP